MKTLVLVAALLAVCYAQPPPEPCRHTEPPKIAETFEAMTMVHRKEHGPAEFSGQGEWCRDMEKGHAVEEVKFTRMNNTEQEERLWLFDKHMEYFIFTNSSGAMCRSHEINENEKMPPVWDWVQHAHCSRIEDHRTNKTFDAWETHVQDMSITLFVDEAMPDTPAGLIRRDRRGEEDVRFTKFTATTPPDTDFEVPDSCKETRRH